jgi:hypothetical protein
MDGDRWLPGAQMPRLIVKPVDANALLEVVAAQDA